MVDRLPSEEPPPRLVSQIFPSTNTLLITLHEEYDQLTLNLQQDILHTLKIDVSHLQCLDFSQFELLRQIRATFFDVRETFKAFVSLSGDPRFNVDLDLKAGTNRSVVFPKGTVPLDLIYTRMSEFGEIEKIWFKMPIRSYEHDNVVIDYFDSRSPLNIIRKLENAL